MLDVHLETRNIVLLITKSRGGTLFIDTKDVREFGDSIHFTFELPIGEAFPWRQHPGER